MITAWLSVRLFADAPPDVTTAWLQIFLQAGAFGVLLFLLWQGPAWIREARDARLREMTAQAQERTEEREARRKDATEERKARHELADQFHRSIISALAANATMREEDRKAFEARNEKIVAALERQTAELVRKLEYVHDGVTEVQKLVVRAEQVTVIPPRSDEPESP